MTVDQFFIINRSGGMVFRYEKGDSTEINNLLVLTSSLYSTCMISSKISGRSTSKQIIHFENRTISIFKTFSSTMFVFVGEKVSDQTFSRVYTHYCEYVTRNPFHTPEMPINCSKFKPHLIFN
ncbi:subunit of transport protein particle complex [Ordospora colligata]|uniref:Trafficking protein particle complex subunit n=1 Tax=Ordospora colligata OC4 TaxID=1354746 RepID=A0A0B2UKJ5_9MICR|nr:subunit of transport protein particle complex [Ordospora colligata OC4]KHN69530.1 subunit of transport protein particle complex [Ordospora colligata OC4]TBU15350.1 subunit of transport protein particle complex [Ordospora colligata]TBU15450.1 subunit of transport protein particle complex [Ordospora colligata]TBU18546.1 subunit of transport protein particle complex [Ordospora colligata]